MFASIGPMVVQCMTDTFQATLADLRARVAYYRHKPVNEENTKAVFIDPVLRGLGWNLEDLDEVVREYRPQSADKPVDYAFLVLGTPRFVLEAKALGENLNDRRWANQIMGYAAVAGVEWVVLTNGDEYRLYNSHASVPVDDKLFRSVRLSEDLDTTAETLALLSRSQIQGRELQALWTAYFVDRQTRAALEKLFVPEPNEGLIRILRRQLDGDLPPGEIRSSLKRLQFRFDLASEEPAVENPVARPVGTPLVDALPGNVTTQRDGQKITVQDLISRGLIKPPLVLHTRFKGRELLAEVNADGQIVFDGRVYDSLSMAGGMARRLVSGPPAKGEYWSTNGWEFWRFTDQDGSVRPIAALRSAARGE